MKISDRLLKVINIVCAVLMLALIVLQFLPFWTVGDNTLSAQKFTWFCTHNTDVNKFFKAEFGDVYSLNTTILPTLGILVFGGLGVVFSLLKASKSINWLWAFLCGGLSCVIGYLTTPTYQLGSNWIVHVIIGAVVTLLSIVLLIRWIQDVIRWFKG